MNPSHFFSAIILSLAFAAGAHAQYPSKAVRIFVPSSPGNSSDITARGIALGLNVVGNKPDEFAAVIKADNSKWAAVIRSNNFRAE